MTALVCRWVNSTSRKVKDISLIVEQPISTLPLSTFTPSKMHPFAIPSHTHISNIIYFFIHFFPLADKTLKIAAGFGFVSKYAIGQRVCPFLTSEFKWNSHINAYINTLTFHLTPSISVL